jgi:hypothetical protein
MPIDSVDVCCRQSLPVGFIAHDLCSKLQGFWLLLQGQGFCQEQSRRKQARHVP